MRRNVLLLVCLLASCANAGVWLNEIHYDDVGSDTGEFVEVVVSPSMAGVNLVDVTVAFYNGNGGGTYKTRTLDDFTLHSTTNGYSFYREDVSGIQNDTDGLSIDIAGALQQFLSYEGTITATAGPANGFTSVDIGVRESNTTTPEGHSLQLKGIGSEYDDFGWSAPSAASAGSVNVGQTLTAVPEPSAFLLLGLLSVAIGARRLRKRPASDA